MKSPIFALIAVLVFSLAAIVGCSPQAADSDGGAADAVPVQFVNAVCPIMGHALDPEVTLEWNGQTVAFCCADCLPEWNALSDGEKAAKLASAMNSGNQDAQHEMTDHAAAGHVHNSEEPATDSTQ